MNLLGEHIPPAVPTLELAMYANPSTLSVIPWAVNSFARQYPLNVVAFPKAWNNINLSTVSVEVKLSPAQLVSAGNLFQLPI